MKDFICPHCGGQLEEPKPHYKLPDIMIQRCEECGRHTYEEGNSARPT